MSNEAIIDANEPEDIKKATRSELEKRGFKVHTESLDQGDFLYPHQDVAVERKTGSDLAASIQDRRISEQADRMVAEHDHVFLAMEGEPYDLEYSNLNHNSIRGQLISLAVKRHMKILPTENKAGTAWSIARLFERFKDGDHEKNTEYLNTYDTGETNDTEVAMIAQVKGISVEKAKEIKNVYGGPAQLAYVQTDPDKVREELKKVDGVGDKLANRVIKFFQLN